MRKIDFKEIYLDKCVFIRVIEEELIIIALYINNILVLIKIEDLIKKIKN